MELLFTSFGMSHLSRDGQEAGSPFYRMPPMSLSGTNGRFAPDYAVLLLCDRIVMDAGSWSRLTDPSATDRFNEVTEAVYELYNEGFIKIVDFDTIVQDNKTLLADMLSHDLKSIEPWISPLKEAIAIWYSTAENFFALNQTFKKMVHSDVIIMHMIKNNIYSLETNGHLLLEMLSSPRKRRLKSERDFLQSTITDFLIYINANIVISNTLDLPFHDWADLAPFYRDKFLSIGRKEPSQQPRVDKIRQLFDVSFPDLNFWAPKTIVSALKDKRLSALRQLVDEAIMEQTDFDREFANHVLKEVLSIERATARWRNIVSYATLPIGFVPGLGTPLQKIVEEVADRTIEGKARKAYQWYYLISKYGIQH